MSEPFPFPESNNAEILRDVLEFAEAIRGVDEFEEWETDRGVVGAEGI